MTPDVASDATGRLVIVWSSFGQDGSHYGVFGRRYDAAGTPGTEFRVNTHTTHIQDKAAVAMAADGSFVVVWESYGQDGPSPGIFGSATTRPGPRKAPSSASTRTRPAASRIPTSAWTPPATSSSCGGARPRRQRDRDLRPAVRRGGSRRRAGVPRELLHDRVPIRGVRGRGCGRRLRGDMERESRGRRVLRRLRPTLRCGGRGPRAGSSRERADHRRAGDVLAFRGRQRRLRRHLDGPGPGQHHLRRVRHVLSTPPAGRKAPTSP